MFINPVNLVNVDFILSLKMLCFSLVTEQQQVILVGYFFIVSKVGLGIFHISLFGH